MAISNFGIGGFDNADSSFQGLGNLSSTFTIGSLPGCTDPTQFNYNVNATIDDGSCIAVLIGCMDASALNYNALANTTTPSSCVYDGCIDAAYAEFNPLASFDTSPSSCLTLITYGCTDVSTSTIGDGSGYNYPDYWNGSSSYYASCDDTNGTGCVFGQTGINCCCEPTIVGCTDVTATNYYSSANYQPQANSNLSCTYDVYGCMDPIADNYDCIPGNINYPCSDGVTIDDGSCTYSVYGCTDPTALNYNPSATVDDGSCVTIVLGCTDATAFNYDNTANVDDGSCTYVVPGCVDVSACNYNTAATVDDGSCILPDGCTDATACNYDASAVCDDGSCLGLLGCTDATAFNFDPTATCDDGSCTYVPSIGDTHQGGIVFYLDGSGGGLIAAPSDQSTSANWSNHAYLGGCAGTNIPGTSKLIGTGNQNTINIDAICTTTGIAADICANLTLNGYSDWFLPSKNELNKMYLNIGQGNALGLGNIGGFATGILSSGYWSSTQRNANTNEAWALFFDNGLPINYTKWNSMIVRAVRSF